MGKSTTLCFKIGSKKTNVKAVHLQGTGQVAVVPVQLKNGEKTLNSYAYLDNGSCQSLLLKSAASELNIDMKFVGKMPIGGYHMTKEIDCAPVKVYIKPLQSDQQSFLLTHVIAVPNLNMSPVDTEKLNQLCASFEHLSHISFPEIAINSVSIIFGIDNLDLIHYKQIGTQECSLGSRDPARLDMCRKDRFGTRRNIHRTIHSIE